MKKLEEIYEEIMNEGTWEVPDMLKKAKSLEKLMKKPIPAKDATDMIGDVIGDDTLFDNIDDLVEEDPEFDVRPYINDYIAKLVRGIEDGSIKTRDAWDPKAIELLKKITKS
jgi:hypothetical protein